jgi:hypothetical protein
VSLTGKRGRRDYNPKRFFDNDTFRRLVSISYKRLIHTVLQRGVLWPSDPENRLNGFRSLDWLSLRAKAIGE